MSDEHGKRRRFLGAVMAGASGAVAGAVAGAGPAGAKAPDADGYFDNLTVGDTFNAGVMYGNTLNMGPIENRDNATFNFDVNGLFLSGPTDNGVGNSGPDTGYGTALHVEANSGPGDAVTISAQKGKALQVTQTAAGTKAAVTVGNAGTGPGVYAKNSSATSTNAAVFGIGGAKGRGGRFTGGAAQITLNPGTSMSHPVVGTAGDLYVDARKRLWFCKGGRTWKQVA